VSHNKIVAFFFAYFSFSIVALSFFAYFEMTLFAPCLIAVVGILISFVYWYYNREKYSDKPANIPPPPPPIDDNSKFIPPPAPIDDNSKLEYEQLSEAMHSRESTTIVGGTILITASIILLGTTLGSMLLRQVDYVTRLVVVLAALAIYIVWLLSINLTSNMLDNICYSKLKDIESKYGLQIHSFVGNQWGRRKVFKFFRRHQWLWLLWVLIIFGIAILLLS
jgi:hypothetical protein